MRAQAHTLEGVAAALVVVVAVTFTLQATAVTPLTASTASQHLETQHERAASGLLEVERANGNLSATLRYWNNSSGSFHDASGEGYYVGTPPDASFLGAVEETFGGSSVAYNVNAYYLDEDGDRQIRRVVYHGQPSSDASAATRVVTLYDDQHVTVRDGDAFVADGDGPRLADSTHFPPNAPGHTYAVVEVEVVVWRM